MTGISRRDFVALTAAGAVATPFLLDDALARAGAAVTAQEIVDRVKKNIGVDWGSDDVDTFKAGDPSTIVTGVVTTSMATLDVLQKAVQAGANLIITAAPTFYSRADLSTPAGRGFGAGGAGRGQAAAWWRSRRGARSVAGDGQRSGNRRVGAHASGPAAAAVRRAAGTAARGRRAGDAPAARSGLRRQERLHREAQAGRVPPDAALEPAHAGPARAGPRGGDGLDRLRQGTQAGDDALRYNVPAVTLEALAGQLKKTLGTRGGIRAIGDRTMTVRKIGLLPGYTLIQASIAMLPNVDVIITGEVQEWESATYAQDVAFAGVKKGFISIGRVVNEAPGMQVCADWLKTIVPEVPVRFISAGDPYWRPL